MISKSLKDCPLTLRKARISSCGRLAVGITIEMRGDVMMRDRHKQKAGLWITLARSQEMPTGAIIKRRIFYEVPPGEAIDM
jgi:hypothetical protein